MWEKSLLEYLESLSTIVWLKYIEIGKPNGDFSTSFSLSGFLDSDLRFLVACG